jgi:signal transduction histidine kinase
MNIDDAKILIVEDNKTNRLILSRRLQKNGYFVEYAVNGAEALEAVEKKEFDLILLDIMMPGMDGFEVCKKLKANPQTTEIPIIFITSVKDVDSTVKGFELGAVDYITKPFNGVELLARINTHLELKRSREELKQINDTKDKFFSIIAHDLKNPLSAIIMSSDFLLDKTDFIDKEKRDRALKTVSNSAHKLHRLLDNLLTWSRTQTGSIRFNPERLNLKRIVEETINFLSENAKKKNIDIHATVDETIEITADLNMCMTIIRNLLSNAIKFTNSGGTVNIEAEQKEKFVEIAVVDNGVGISPENIEKLFRIDMNFSTKGTSSEIGTGLGLSVCKEFVGKHGGKIWAESDIDNGSTFRFTLPLKTTGG